MEAVTSYLESVGMWAPEHRAQYDFLLSPEVFVIKSRWQDQLAGFAVTLREYFTDTVGVFPALCKVDVMIDRNGRLKVAEVDGLNKRALGYAILQRNIARLFGHSSARFFCGNEHALKRLLGGKSLHIIVPGRERYYRFGFNVLTDQLRDLGVEASWGHEKATVSLLKEASPTTLAPLDAPRTGHSECDALIDSGWEVLIPNQSFFSSKVNLIGLASELVPMTLPGSVDPIPFERFVVKHVGRSGSKGVFFNDEAHELTPDQYVVQELVEGAEFELCHYDRRGKLVTSGGWQIRLIVTLDLTVGSVADVDVTACQGRLVHGEANSIQIAGVRE